MSPKKKKSSSFVSFLVFILLIIASVITFVLIVPVYSKYKNMERELGELKKKLEKKHAECNRLNRLVNDLRHSPKAAEKVAREKFGLCRKGEVIFKYDKKEIPVDDKSDSR